ncbi:hypothetical protein PCL_10616 [Purpureocillium lilacinum]|uniref:Uncharacterized protein n=1 Tax=Purpureocillium lilacinum TaxID=33203 RepID=A0A2U3EC04_PURLI|nr:hypothetical protein PCL_10616 [Purpureocillium lilacinum]
MQLQTLFSLFLAFAGMGIAAPTNAGPKDVSDTKDITTGSDAVTPMGWNDCLLPLVDTDLDPKILLGGGFNNMMNTSGMPHELA